MKFVASVTFLPAIAVLLVLAGCERAPEIPGKTAENADAPVILETHIRELQLEDDAVQTRFGKVEISRTEVDMPPDTLKLDGQQIFRVEGFYLSLHYYIKQNERDLLLFGSNCGGTGCPQNDFHVLVLQKGADPQILTDKDFTAYLDDLEITVDGKRLQVDLGFQGGKHKVASLLGDQLTVELQTVPKSFVGEANCRWVYDEVLRACREYRETDASCADPQAGFAGYMTRGIAAVAEHPGFSSEAFSRRCNIACGSGKMVDYSTFSKEVCSK